MAKKIIAVFDVKEIFNLPKHGLITSFQFELDSNMPRKGEKMLIKGNSLKSSYKILNSHITKFFVFDEIFTYEDYWLSKAFEFEVKEITYSDYETQLTIDLTDEMKEKIDFKEAKFQFLEKFKDFVEFREMEDKMEKDKRDRKRKFWNTISFGLLCIDEGK